MRWAIHLKLNEIVVAMEGASNRLIDVEDLTEGEIEMLHKHYQALVVMAKNDATLIETHSVEEAAQGQEGETPRRVMIGCEHFRRLTLGVILMTLCRAQTRSAAEKETPNRLERCPNLHANYLRPRRR